MLHNGCLQINTYLFQLKLVQGKIILQWQTSILFRGITLTLLYTINKALKPKVRVKSSVNLIYWPVLKYWSYLPIPWCLKLRSLLARKHTTLPRLTLPHSLQSSWSLFQKFTLIPAPQEWIEHPQPFSQSATSNPLCSHPPSLNPKLLEGRNHFLLIFEFQNVAEYPAHNRQGKRLNLTLIIIYYLYTGNYGWMSYFLKDTDWGKMKMCEQQNGVLRQNFNRCPEYFQL